MNKIDQLSDLYAKRDADRLAFEAEQNAILAKVRDELLAVEDKWGRVMAETQEAITDAEQAVKDETLACGTTQRGAHHQAVYRKGYVKVTWDTKRLDGYAAAHTEILPFRKETQVEPTVSIQAVG